MVSTIKEYPASRSTTTTSAIAVTKVSRDNSELIGDPKHPLPPLKRLLHLTTGNVLEATNATWVSYHLVAYSPPSSIDNSTPSSTHASETSHPRFVSFALVKWKPLAICFWTIIQTSILD
ncbi:hypothetical protein O0I10_000553 [Lichtheimia ornata]|uniref:Uncharacterized protein n=1 Tax=Lichtheimia ornata TaxID=688661 RepID=A0AAD8DHH7_9FUNG|nr:uncharacterized protein O0I10_000553 [Lichtheimia ornata]KAJ8663314.1 hypothetical protein O0I10_000553 [Lichtheimia ornata]